MSDSAAAQRALILETANRVALDILSNRAGIEALRHIAEAARVLAQARYAALGVARPEGTGLQEFVTVGLAPEEEAALGALPTGKGVLGLFLARDKPLRIDQISEHPASVGFPPHHPPMDSFLGVPIRRGETVLGSLYLTNKQGDSAFSAEDEAAVEALAAHAAIAIHHWQMLLRQRALMRGLLMAQEEERRAVAYDLHDGLTQYVMASHAHLEAFLHERQSGQEDRAEGELKQGLQYLKEAVVESRRLVNNMRLLSLEDLGLAGSLELLLEQEKASAGWEDTDFIHNITGRRFESALETGAYRVAQEALTNARKHAETTHVRLLLLTEKVPLHNGDNAERLRLEVRDWGRGFVPEDKANQIADEMGHVGLQGIIERVHLLDGTCELRSTPGEGATLFAVFPVLKSSPMEQTKTQGEDT